MILLVLAFIGLATIPLFGGSFSRFSTVTLRHTWLVWGGVLGQIVLFEGPWTPSESVAGVLHLATYAVSGAFLLLNWKVPGAPLVGLGGSLNLAAIVANDGVMPASEWAARVAGLNGDTGRVENSMVNADARLWWFGDIFAIPESWPMSNVFSIGDIVLVVAIVYFGFKVCVFDNGQTLAIDDDRIGAASAAESVSVGGATLGG
jgi:hypothetical protein